MNEPARTHMKYPTFIVMTASILEIVLVVMSLYRYVYDGERVMERERLNVQ